MSALDQATQDALVAAARAVQPRAYAPYSGYHVGAALLTRAGRVFAGCNVENASYGLAICAERSAVAQMIAAGDSEPIACVVVTHGAEAGSPCGMCRQTLAEFAIDMPVRLLTADAPAAGRTTTLAALLPDAFRSDKLNRK